MFDKIRKPGRAKGIFAYIVFGAICIVFVFLGFLPNQSGISSGGPAAIVNKTPISISDFREVYGRQEQRLRERLNALPAAQRQEELRRMRSQVINYLVDNELVSQEAEENDIYASEEQIRDAILEIPIFQEEGRFRREFYNTFLENRRTTAQKFEKEIAKQLQLNRIRDVMQKSLIQPPSLKELEEKAQQVQVNIAYAGLSKKSLSQKLNVSASEAEKYASENPAEVEKYYKQNISDYSTPEQVKARHILVKTSPEDPASEEKALQKIKEIKTSVTPENFAQVAAEKSEDLGTKAKSGDLGFFARGAMVPAFERAAFSLAAGEISEPVKTPFGYHLIYVEEKKAGSEKKLDAVKTDVAMQVLKQNRAEELIKEFSELVKTGDSAEVSKWLQTQGVQLQETGLFFINRRARIPNEEFVELVLSNAKPGEFLDKLVPYSGTQYVLQFKEMQKKAANDSIQQLQQLGISSGQSAADIFRQWTEGLRDQADIEYNAQLIMGR